MKILKKIVSPILLVFILMMSMQSYASAEQIHPDINNKEQVEKYFDENLNKLLKKYPVPGAVVSVVKDGKLLFIKGYGYSDLQKKIPVNPDTMTFRLASVTKTMTASAIMQLVEQGKIDVNEDVNKYLNGFTIKGKNGEKITIHQLLTHTAGFDETLAHLNGKPISLKQYIENNLPKMIKSPGVDTSYSNYAYILLGLIIEEVTGQSYEEYIQQHIFNPLGMKNSTFTIPNNLAKSYDVKSNGKYVYMPARKINGAPAGGVITKAKDMANYMMAHLQSGKFKDVLMKEETSKIMQTPHFTIHPGISGVAYNFWQDTLWESHQSIMHGGTAEGFRSNLYLIPDEKFGVFIDTNSTQGRLLYEDFFKQFHKDFFPQSLEHKISANATKKSELKKALNGSYRPTRYVHHETGKFMTLLNQPEEKVTALADGKIELTLHGVKKVFNEKEKNLFVEENGPDSIYFYKTADGESHFTISSIPIIAYEKVPWYSHASFKLAMFLLIVLPALLSILFYPISWIGRKILKKESDPKVTKFRRVSWISGTLYTLYLIIALTSQEFRYTYDYQSFTYAIVLPIIALLLNVRLIPLYTSLLKGKLISGWASFIYLVLIIFGFLYILNLIFWNLLGVFF